MRPLFLVENLFSDVQSPAHVVDASSETPGYEAWRVATGRRSVHDRWQPTTAGEGWIRVDCGAARTADMAILDRGHNLAGVQVKVQHSTDGGVWTTAATSTIPAAATDPGDVDAANGARTHEGAWLKRFPSKTARWWRFLVPAAAGIRAEIVGLWVGESWTPSQYFDLPWGDEDIELGWEEVTSSAGWRAAGHVSRARAGTIDLKLSNESEYDDHARRHIHQQFWLRRPMWIVYNDERAERAVLALPRPGSAGFDQRAGWGHRQGMIPWLEHEPRLS
ncbi:MAG TPA: hypothetical protein VFI91_13240 [Longimicrobiaceae bacterium]|nr:hypothetical protein [Longimicrobiaceae bacterium]